ncbi:phosphate-regulating neutral endopeptidase [Trichonephila clavipes]|nr:phosphate-regulating neutral endopeptidase [Trichonephila clavipes]
MNPTYFNCYKNRVQTYQGIPQCCVLSPILFSLLIFGVEKYAIPSQIGLFTDDVIWWCSDANISKWESQLNRSIVNIKEFADNHKITSNASQSTELVPGTPKHSSHPKLLRQLALEVINVIPDQALIIYTYGSRSDTGRAGSGIFSNTPEKDVKISIRNSNHCSVFKSETHCY